MQKKTTAKFRLLSWFPALCMSTEERVVWSRRGILERHDEDGMRLSKLLFCPAFGRKEDPGNT